MFDGYASPLDFSEFEQDLDGIRVAVDDIYPTGHERLDWELERVISIVQPANHALLDEVLSRVTVESHPVDDIHRLIVVARIPTERSGAERERIARALVHLETKIRSRDLRQDSNWDDRILEMYQALVAQDPRLPVALLADPDFGQPGHVQFLSAFPGDQFDAAISAFVRQIRKTPDYAWNSDVVFLLAESEIAEERDLIRPRFDDFALRNAVLMSLAADPEERDRRYFVDGLESAPVEALKECVNALSLLAPSQDARENVLLLRTLRNVVPIDDERMIRDQTAELLRRNLQVEHGYRAGLDGDPQLEAIAAWTETISQKFPEEFARQSGSSDSDADALSERLASVEWNQGDHRRGQVLFDQRGCVQCHGGRRALGPDLAGVAGRFSRDDLFTAIAFPHKDVSPRYQTIQIATVDGHIRTGLVVYESVDGMVLRDSNNQTYRIETEDIEIRRRLSQSLMPAGLLKDLTAGDLADLYAYLHSLGIQTAHKE